MLPVYRVPAIYSHKDAADQYTKAGIEWAMYGGIIMVSDFNTVDLPYVIHPIIPFLPT